MPSKASENSSQPGERFKGTKQSTWFGRGKLDGWQEMIFFFRFSSSTGFSIWQPKNARTNARRQTCLALKLATLPSSRVTYAHGSSQWCARSFRRLPFDNLTLHAQNVSLS